MNEYNINGGINYNEKLNTHLSQLILYIWHQYIKKIKSTILIKYKTKESPRVRVEPAIPEFKVEELIQCATELVKIVGDT